MSNVDPGEPSYTDSDRITRHSANGTGVNGNAVAFDGNGELVLTSGTNGFAGILGTTPDGAGDGVALQVQGIVPAFVSAAVPAGNGVAPDANGELTGTGAVAKVGEIRVMRDSYTLDGGQEVAEVLL